MTKKQKDQFVVFFTSGFYSGYSPIAPGTFGTLVGILYFIPFMFLDSATYFIALIALTGISCYTAHLSNAIHQKVDSGRIVIDEIVGYLFTLLWIPIHFSTREEILWDFLPKVILAFFIFRLFDILKPQPARWIDTKVKNGAGVVLDDVFAGIYSNLALRCVLFLWGVSGAKNLL